MDIGGENVERMLKRQLTTPTRTGGRNPGWPSRNPPRNVDTN